MSYIPRSHYLTLHDAVQKLLGPDAQLAAFVKAKKDFQCDMLVNSARTDPLALMRVGAAVGGASSSSSPARTADTNTAAQRALAKKGVVVLARELQELMGACDVVPHTHRIDVAFRDRTVLQLALGPDKSDLPFPVSSGADINQEPDWRLRNRLRLSLGFDEELFLADCTRSVNVAARVMEKSVRDYIRTSSVLVLNPKIAAAFEASGKDWHAVEPPVIYWQVHGYALDKAYGCRHYQNIAATIEHNFAEYYGVFPLDNPYCPGEDLNTIEVVKWLCEARKTGAMLTVGLDAAMEEEEANVVTLNMSAAEGGAEGEESTQGTTHR